MNNLEIWKDIPKYEGIYQVSNKGRVKNTATNYIMGQHERNGYLRVCLSKSRKTYWESTHRLVAQAFVKNNNNKPQVNHIDGNKKNNMSSNLEWCTNKENCLHAVKHNLFHKKTNKKIAQFSLEGEKIKVWETLSEIENKTGIDKRLVHRCCNNPRIKQSKNYIWKYEEEKYE